MSTIEELAHHLQLPLALEPPSYFFKGCAVWHSSFEQCSWELSWSEVDRLASDMHNSWFPNEHNLHTLYKWLLSFVACGFFAIVLPLVSCMISVQASRAKKSATKFWDRGMCWIFTLMNCLQSSKACWCHGTKPSRRTFHLPLTCSHIVSLLILRVVGCDVL